MARRQIRTSQRHPRPPRVLEADQRLSRSRLWQWQRDFFAQQGIAAWREGTVPHYITSNPFIAQAYARVVLGFLRDSTADTARPLDLRRPVYVVELGGGSGRFAYHFLQKFVPLWQGSRLQAIPITYVLTDFAPRTVAYWQAHPALRPFVEAGLLDFACYDLEQDQRLVLTHSGAVLAPGTVTNPLIVLANYFFDSLPQDAFCVSDGQLCESLVTLTGPAAAPDPAEPGMLERVRASYRAQPAPDPYYGDPDLDAILRAYPAQVGASTWLFPHVALRGLRALARLAGGRMLLLSGDKGYILADDIPEQREPPLVVHGSISLPVNYHALAEYVRRAGGTVLQPPHAATHLTVGAFLWGTPPGGFRETTMAYTEAIVQGGPDDFFTQKKAVEPHYGALTLEQLLAHLRLSGWDGNIFRGCFPALMARVGERAITEPLRRALYQAVQQIWALHYPIGEEPDLAIYLGLLMYELGYTAEARALFNTVEDSEESPVPAPAMGAGDSGIS